jgi:hypothetical protein
VLSDQISQRVQPRLADGRETRAARRHKGSTGVSRDACLRPCDKADDDTRLGREPIPSPASVTKEFSDMFCALKGATDTPRRASQRQRPATMTVLPASDVVPAIRRLPDTANTVDGNERWRTTPRHYQVS